MLKPAKAYDQELQRVVADTALDERLKWWSSSYIEPVIDIDTHFYNKTQLVSVYNNIVIGYFSASWRRPENFVYSLRCVNFHNQHKGVFAKDIQRFLDYLVNVSNTPKINWSVYIGNPIEKTYDRFCERHGGRIVGIFKSDVVINGKYYDKKVYEWINHKWICSHCGYTTRKGAPCEEEIMCKKCGMGEMIYKNPFNFGAS
jgi:hypothetical protein